MKIKLLTAILSLSIFAFGVYVGIELANGKSSAAGTPPRLTADIAINCGSAANSTAFDGRKWVGESSASQFVSGVSTTSVAAHTSFLGAVDPVPYKTSRISATEFRYTFQVNPGQKIVRLHFYPASYRGSEEWIDYFTVKAGSFTLLRNYSASFAAHALAVKYIVKEFFLNVEEENLQLSITFTPSSLNGKLKKKKSYAFVNGIEIISMPTGLYYTPEHDLGARIAGLSNVFHIVDNTTALEVIERLNVGGNSISPVEDFGMFRRWNEDTSYFLGPRTHRVSHLALQYTSKTIPAFVAPPKIYRTSWKLDGGVSQVYLNFTWKIRVDLGFGYLVRLHFCELDYRMVTRDPREFSVLINNDVVETEVDVTTWSGEVGIPVYRDYVVVMEGDFESSKCDLLISLQSVDQLVLGLLHGVEILKLSNLENNLAASNDMFPSELSARNLRTEIFSLQFGQSNIIWTAITGVFVLLSILSYTLRKIREDVVQSEKYVESASVKLSYRCFSLAQVKLATENFSEAFVVGKGGFGKVYKGLIPGFPDVVAIKRLDSSSRQGAVEFQAEIETLSKLRHIHLLSLIGCCNEGTEMILVYEYIPGGTLADNLYKYARKGQDCPPISWEQRIKICIGAARGLEYLHTSSEYGVIHRDVKDTNILLDDSFLAKISDFGLAKLEQTTKSKSYVVTKVKGTLGYMDPDYFTTHKLTRKSDVYSFGIVMLVVLSGKPAVDTINPVEPVSVLSCFRECMAEGDVSKIIDPKIQGEVSSNSLTQFVKIAHSCLSQLPKSRPTMAQVMSSLEQALEQHRSSASVDTTLIDHPLWEDNSQSFRFSHKIPEESLVSPPPPEVSTRKHKTQYFTSKTRGENLQSRRKFSGRILKSVSGWSWKPAWNRDTTKNSLSKSNIRKDDSILPTSAQEVENFKGSSAVNSLTSFSLAEVKMMTKNFRRDEMLGEGGFGRVYKGFLAANAKSGPLPIAVAVKKLDSSSVQGHREWLSEVTFLGQILHPNLVKLFGYCLEDDNKMLVYEYMPNGSLDNCLFSKSLPPVSWSTRMRIAFGAAKGLAHLHHGLGMSIIHRDFKTSNILLDEDYNAKLSDFGLAKDGPTGDRTHVSTAVMGTLGYVAPEYIMTGHLTRSSDVYSYGVVIVELLTGRRASDRTSQPRYQRLINWAMPSLRRKGKLVSIMDPRLEGDFPIKDVQKVGMLAYNCLNADPKERPTMQEIVDLLLPLQEMA